MLFLLVLIRDKNKLYYRKVNLNKEVFKMTGWEIALIMVAFTYMMVNTVYLIVQIKMMNEWKGVLTKSLKMMESIIEHSEKVVTKMFKDFEEDEL